MLDYTLIENLLTAAPDDFMAHTVDVRSYSNEEIADGILKLNVGIGKPEILAMLEAYEEVIAGIIADGGAVNTRLFHAQPAIAGVFNTAADSYDPSRHRIKMNLSAGAVIKDAAAKIRARKVQAADAVPVIVEVKDMVSGSVNEHLTSGGVVQVRGSRLKLAETDAANGIFLLPEAGGAEVKLPTIIENKPARLIALLPALAAGDYHLEVRTNIVHGGKPSQALKIGRFNKSLSVGGA